METRLKGLIEELVRTERSYLSRVEALKKVRCVDRRLLTS